MTYEDRSDRLDDYLKPRKIGRPTSYKPEYIDVANEHFSVAYFEEYFEEVAIPTIGIEVIKKVRARPFPSMSGLAIKLGVTRQRLKEWGERNPDFQDALNMGREVIRDFLLNHSITGRYNSNFAKFVASSLTDLGEKQEEESDVEFI
jgi:hypothetical protein